MEEKYYKKLYEDVVALAKDGLKDELYLSRSAKDVTEFLFPQLKETEDEKVRRELTTFLINFNNGAYSRPSEYKIDSWIKWLDKKCEQPQCKSALEVWKDMRLEVYQQASGNRHEPNYSDDSTKMFSLNDIDEIIEKMSEQKPTERSEEDTKELESIFSSAKHVLTDDNKKWLKSLRPQNRWKPSEEQLRAIINSAQGLYQCKEKEVLLDLYEQLKSL